MGIQKRRSKKSSRIRQGRRNERFISGADVLADAAERMGDGRLRISRKRPNAGSR
jgi:hypothetical protein